MVESVNQRLKLLYLRDYLLNNTNSEKSVTRKDIENHLGNYDIKFTRQTLHNDILLLRDYGMDIKMEMIKNKGHYKVITRNFDTKDLELLIGSVQACKFITQEKADELTKKLKNLVSGYDKRILNKQNYISIPRSTNNNIFNYIDKIQDSISNNMYISFKYFHINEKKKAVYNKKLITLLPIACVWNDYNYYLIGYHGETLKHYRVDRMDEVEVFGLFWEKEEIDIQKYVKKLFSMFRGRAEYVHLRFSNYLADVVFERFGKDIHVELDGKSHFTVVVDVEVSEKFFAWLCGFGKGVVIKSPEHVVEEMAKYVSGISNMYRKYKYRK